MCIDYDYIHLIKLIDGYYVKWEYKNLLIDVKWSNVNNEP